MICYDITKENTFNNVDKWVQELEDHADEDVIKILIANKLDLEDNRVFTNLIWDSKNRRWHSKGSIT